MLKFNITKKTLESLQVSGMREENILERYGLQHAMVSSWEVARDKLGLSESFLIGQEVNPHYSVGNSIDLLAFDPDDSTLIVIELKRDKNKLQLLQALSYAAMVATWDKEQLISKIQRDINKDPGELIDFINNNDLNPNVKIILLSETYDPEVIITAEWLSRTYRVDIIAFAATVLKLESDTFINFEQRLPLKELADVYERRGQRARTTENRNEVTWESVIPNLKYDFGSEAVRLFTKEKEGDPSRKRIIGIGTQIEEFSRMDVHFPEKYMRMTFVGTPDNAEAIIQSKFSMPIEVSPHDDWFSFRIETNQQFEELLNWLKISRS